MTDKNTHDHKSGGRTECRKSKKQQNQWKKARQSWQEQHKSRSKLLVGIRRT
jgi:hypothetical protein